MFECEKCGSPTRAMVQMSVVAPSEMMHKFSKKNMSSKDFRIQGVLWETADFLCVNSACGHVTDGYGNYVTNLKKENQQLKSQYFDGLREGVNRFAWMKDGVYYVGTTGMTLREALAEIDEAQQKEQL